MSRRLVLALAAGTAVTAAVVLVARAPAVRWWTLERALAARFPNVERISTEELAAALAGPRPPVLLDTRPEEEFAVSHLRGALRVDPDATAFPALDTLARDTPIVTYCSVGWRSAAVAERLRAAGFTAVRNLEGSLFRWANEGRPLARGDAQVRVVHPYDATWGRLLHPELRAPLPPRAARFTEG